MRIAAPAEEEEEGERYKLRRIRGEGGGSWCWVRSCYRMDDDMPLTGRIGPPEQLNHSPSPRGRQKKGVGEEGVVELCAENVLPQKRNRIFVTAM